MLDKTDKIKCQWCNEVSTVEDWENETYKECNTREMKRKYVSLYDEKAFKRTSKTFYKCTCCGRWLRGSQLTVTEAVDKANLKLGGESVVTTKPPRTKGKGR